MRPIHHTFAPLGDWRQIRLALSLLARPGRWLNGLATGELRAELGRGLGGDAFLFGSGREALLALLRALGIGAGHEVIVQCYTCVVVPNAIRAAGATPVYADIEQDTLNMELDEVEKLITTKTKAIICQHTFGIPAPLLDLKNLCAKRGIALIEDCAHVLPDRTGPLGLATTGDAAILSFGRDKAISGVLGGAVICHRPNLRDALSAEEKKAAPMSPLTVAISLLYPLLYAKGKLLYAVGLGKAYLYLCARLGLLLPIVTREEKHGRQPATLNRFAAANAALALDQWRRLTEVNDHRRMLTALYLRESKARNWPAAAGAIEGLPLQKFPLFVRNADVIRAQLKAQNIHLQDGWTGCVICPDSADANASGYVAGCDPTAEAVSTSILSLPTHPTMSERQAMRLVAALDPLLRNSR